MKIILIFVIYIIYLKANKRTKNYSDKVVNLCWFLIINILISRLL